MSAFICSAEHFKALGLFAAQRTVYGFRVNPRYIEGIDPKVANFGERALANYYANVLLDENVRSVAERYPNDTDEELPGDGVRIIRITAQDEAGPLANVPALAILKMLDCWEYQSCETEDWQQSLANRIAHAIRGAAIRALPGYDDAPWEYREAA